MFVLVLLLALFSGANPLTSRSDTSAVVQEEGAGSSGGN